MINKSWEILIPEATSKFNEGKLPALEISEELGAKIVQTQFRMLKKFFTQPWHYKVKLPKSFIFVIRYRCIREEIMQRINYCQKAKRDIKYLTEQINNGRVMMGWPGYEIQPTYFIIMGIEQSIAEKKKEIYYWWILKQQYMRDYTKTGTYKRLQLLRGRWRDLKEKSVIFKEDYVKEKISQIGEDKNALKKKLKEKE